MTSFAEWEYVKFRPGDRRKRAHIDAVHAASPKADRYTGEIADDIAAKASCSVIIAIVSRRVADLNRPPDKSNWEAIKEYRQAIRLILGHIRILDDSDKLKRPYLHLAVHGMADRRDSDVGIGTRHGVTCSSSVRNWLIDRIRSDVKRSQVDGRFPGDPSKSFHRHGDEVSGLGYPGYGNNFNTFQIEISRTLRKNHREELTDMFADMIVDFNDKFR